MKEHLGRFLPQVPDCDGATWVR